MEVDRNEHIEKNKKQTSNRIDDDGVVFQSTWIRHNTTLVNPSNWESLVRQFRYVFYCGVVLWIIHVISLVI
jgi:hypothetical protein